MKHARHLVLATLFSMGLSAGRPAFAVEDVDLTPLPLETELAFPEIRIPRPIIVTHAGDGTDRVFVASQYGEIRVFPNDQAAANSAVFLDIRERVVYKDNENEEGLLGVAFHPKYEENGEFFIYYTTRTAPHTSVVSRFRVSPDDPNRADPRFEEEIMRVKQPFWNHNGGTIEFGPDGYLYIALGDGGAANDPLQAGQNLGMLLGSILRIDIDRRDPGLAYAIPRDNPFVDRTGARGEIWAYGLRNVWRFSFDRATGAMWAGDVGQNLWEEINIITRGGNYGWSLREARHKFEPNGSEARPDLIDPIWEYHHNVGKSITGGNVYRGKRLPELDGAYLYGDYVSGKVWALWFDAAAGRVIANREIKHPSTDIVTFGEDQAGEVYFTSTMKGGTIYRFKRAE